ncbi:8015_t:CDS:2, partial [Gigaspora margarita]
MKHEFEQLHYIPNPTPSKDLYYKSFEELYGTTISEEYRPLFKDAKFKNTKLDKTRSFHNTCDLAFTKSINPAKINESNDYQSNNLNNNQPSNNQQSNDQLSDNLPSNDTAADNMIARSNCSYIE